MAEEDLTEKDEDLKSGGGIKGLIAKITSSKKMMMIAGGAVLLLFLLIGIVFQEVETLLVKK